MFGQGRVSPSPVVPLMHGYPLRAMINLQKGGCIDQNNLVLVISIGDAVPMFVLGKEDMVIEYDLPFLVRNGYVDTKI